MVLNNFSPIIQLAATLNIALVAVEYAKSYTSVLYEQVFKFKDFIEESFDTCLRLLTDKESLESLDPQIINGRSTNYQIEDVKRKHEKKRTEIENEKQRKIAATLKICESKSISSLSLYLFLYSLTTLFLCGFEDNESSNLIIHGVWSIYTLLTLAYLIIGWSKGENENHKFLCLNFSSLLNPTWVALCLLAISISICTIAIHSDKTWVANLIDIAWTTILITGVLMMYSNFVAFAIRMWHNAKNIRTQITQSSESLKQECADLKKEADDLITVSRVSDKLAVDSKNDHTTRSNTLIKFPPQAITPEPYLPPVCPPHKK